MLIRAYGRTLASWGAKYDGGVPPGGFELGVGHHPQMAELKIWLTEQIEQKQVEPNSGLGEAIGYMLRHWQKRNRSQF